MCTQLLLNRALSWQKLQNCILQDKIFLWRYLKQMSIAIG
ncbi:hypothetical protein HMPREF1584_00667 [Gardnerella vaginalis JCP8481A]|nr:hypothetical protein HMPREF1584_00667 [Gardnerella vaginalis JCP8481A]